MGPGYAPVPYKIVSKITAGLFVDLADLFPDKIRAQEIQPKACLQCEDLVYISSTLPEASLYLDENLWFTKIIASR